MPKKYNLALIPVSKGVEAVRFAKKFAGLADKYLLGDNSLPHVTIYQFEYEPISDKFVLSLGISDDIGQLVKVVHCCEVKPSDEVKSSREVTPRTTCKM